MASNSNRSLIFNVAATLVALVLLWLSFTVYSSGQAVWAVLILGLGGLSVYVYVSARTLAWRYLFPGVMAMLVFVAFPLVYTVQIGFTNYSANNLLSEARARAYLLEQADVNESRAMTFAVYPEGDKVRLLLTPQGEAAPTGRYLSAPLSLTDKVSAPIAMQPYAGEPALSQWDRPYDLRQTIAQREFLMLSLIHI